MPHPIDSSTLRILKPTGETVGTGFLVARNLVATCAHVVKILGACAGDRIDVRFTGKSASTTALVLPEFWRPDEATDIAILQVDEVPVGVFPLRMGRANESRLKNDLYTFGYAIAADEQGIGGLGTFITLKQDGNFIQFRMHEANHGHSGAPIYDDKCGVVVGMIKKGHTGTGRNAETTYAIPSETLWQICPQLNPPTPILPRRNPIVEGINLLPYDYNQRIQNFLTEYLGTDAHPVPFGGRDDALKMLDTWLAETTPYLLLAAPAGRGKSALLVRWLDSLKAREDLALAFVPVSIRFGTNMERVFYAALAARLAHLHGDDIPASPETSTAVYRGLVSDYLSKPLANGRTLLVVLDGLDEAADWQAGADFMPGDLPAGVRVVVSARFLAGDADSTAWLRRLNWERNGLASAPFLTPLDQEGVRDVLFKMGCPLDELSHKVDIVAELYRLSVGDPLLVGLYVGDLWTKGEEVTRLQPEDLTDIQPGYKGYFDRWWDDQKKLWGKEKPWLEKHVRAVRNLLAGALGPLFRDDFQALDPELQSDYIADALEILQRFIIGDNQNQGYTFGHPKLGQYFWDEMTQSEQVQVEGYFLNWCEQIFQEFVDGKRDPKKKAEVPVYVVHNYSAHLARANQLIEKWLPLIHYQQWAQAWFTVEGAYGGYLQDVQRVREQYRLLDRQAIEKADKTPYLGQQIRCGLIEASLHSSADNIPPKLIWPLVRDGIWTLPQAWVFIRQMSESYQKSQAIIALIPNLTDDQLLEAQELARECQDVRDRANVLNALVQRLPEVAGEAVEAARAMETENGRAEMLSVLAELIPDGVLEQVLEATRTLQDDRSRASVLSALAQHLPEGMLVQVLEATQAIEEVYRSGVLCILAERMPDRVLEQVLEAAQTIQDEGYRLKVLSSSVKRMPERELMQILEATRTIQNEWSRADVLSTLAQRLPEGELRQILGAARTIQNAESRAKVLGTFAKQMPEVVGEALEAAMAITWLEERVRVLSDLAEHIPERELGLVLEASRVLQYEGWRAKVLRVLARRMPDEYLEQVLSAMQANWFEPDRVSILSELVRRMPDAKLEQVLAEVRAIRDKVDRARLLSILAQRRPAVAGEALEVARSLETKEARASVLNELAVCLPGITEEALTAARAIKKDEYYRAILLSELAEQMPEMAGEAVEAARSLQYKLARNNALSDLAIRLPRGALGQMLEAVQAIEDERARAKVLRTLATRVSEGALGQILEAAWVIRDEGYRALVLSVLAERVPGVKGEALETAQAIKYVYDLTEVWSTLARYMPESRKEALELAVAIQNEWSRAYALKLLALRLPEEELGQILVAAQMIKEFPRIEVMSALIERMPERALGQILEAARVFQNEESRAKVLSLLVGRMPEVKEEAIESARALTYEIARAEVFTALAKHLPDTALGQVLDAARAIQHEESRAEVLSVLAQRLPEVAGEALKAARAIKGNWGRARTLIVLAERMLEVTGEALEETLAISEEGIRANVLRDFAQLLMRVPNAECYSCIEFALSQFALRMRGKFYEEISTMMPALIHLGNEDTPREIYEAVRDVTEWWP